MKLIIAYIQPHKLGDVKRSLYKAEVFKMSVTNSLWAAKGLPRILSRGGPGGEPAQKGAARDRRQRQLCRADGPGDHQGRQIGPDRRWKNLHSGFAGMHPHPDRRKRRLRHRLIHNGHGMSRLPRSSAANGSPTAASEIPGLLCFRKVLRCQRPFTHCAEGKMILPLKLMRRANISLIKTQLLEAFTGGASANRYSSP
jgi:hypothetical protein